MPKRSKTCLTNLARVVAPYMSLINRSYQKLDTVDGSILFIKILSIIITINIITNFIFIRGGVLRLRRRSCRAPWKRQRPPSSRRRTRCSEI